MSSSQLKIQPLDKAQEFHLEDLFFSTTNLKGIITGCNKTFAVISGYAPEEMLGRPHNMVRHPDMPRCVFKLLWDYLLKNRSLGAYVKNLVKTGEYYWVFAMAMPTPEGFLSIRVKPTSKTFEMVEALYAELSEIEKSAGKDHLAGMTAATEHLHKRLAEHGFSSYDEFMAHALREEITARSLALGRTESRSPIESIFADMSSLIDLRSTLEERLLYFDEFGSNITRIALNANVVSARLLDAGRALGVISNELSVVATGISAETVTVGQELDSLSKSLRDTSFMVSFCTFITEMQDSFSNNPENRKLNDGDQVRQFGQTVGELDKILDSCRVGALQECATKVGDLARALRTFEDFSVALTRMMLNLQFGHVTGQSIAAGITGGAAFSILLQDIVEHSTRARDELGQFELATAFAKGFVGRLRNQTARHAIKR